MATTRRACAIGSYRGSGKLACSLHVQPRSATPRVKTDETAHAVAEQADLRGGPQPAPIFSPSQFRTPGFSAAQIAVLFAAFTLLISIPIWTHPLPPLADYVNHLARMHAIATLATNPQLARFYELDWQWIPNLTMDVLVPPLARVMNIYLAGQVFIVSMFALIISGALVLSRALNGRWTVLPLFAIPLLYNYVFLVGLMNYIFGIGRRVVGPGRLGRDPRPCVADTLRVIDRVCRGAVLLPFLGARHLRDRRALVRDRAAVGPAIGTLAWPNRWISSPADCRFSPLRRCFMPARPCSSFPRSPGTSAARSTG